LRRFRISDKLGPAPKDLRTFLERAELAIAAVIKAHVRRCCDGTRGKPYASHRIVREIAS
jgi:hypothetical protein